MVPGTARAEQQVAAELEVQFDEAGVERPCLDAFEPHVRRQCLELLVRLRPPRRSRTRRIGGRWLSTWRARSSS